MTGRPPSLALDHSDDLSPPAWPDVDDETEAAIGRLVIAWGVLESEIDNAIRNVYGLNDDWDLAWSMTANLGTKAKLEIFQSAVHCLEDYFDKGTAKDVDRLVNDTATAASHHRNFVAHGQPIKLVLSDTDQRWLWMTQQARKGGPKAKIAGLTHDAFDNSSSEVRALVDRWHAFRLCLAKGMEFKAWSDRN